MELNFIWSLSINLIPVAHYRYYTDETMEISLFFADSVRARSVLR